MQHGLSYCVQYCKSICKWWGLFAWAVLFLRGQFKIWKEKENKHFRLHVNERTVSVVTGQCHTWFEDLNMYLNRRRLCTPSFFKFSIWEDALELIMFAPLFLHRLFSPDICIFCSFRKWMWKGWERGERRKYNRRIGNIATLAKIRFPLWSWLVSL